MPIPATHTEIEQIYLAAEMNHCRSVCITGCSASDGVTSIATALTERYLLAGHQTLLVDLNMLHPAFEELDMVIGDTEEHWVEHKETHQLFTGLTIPTDRSTQLAYKDPNNLQKAVQLWLTRFDRVIIDTSPILKINRGNIPAQSVASACDKTILVVRGGTTTSSQLTKAVELLQSERISLLGTILNVKDQPTLAQEIIRELRRLRLIPQKLRLSIERRLTAIEMLSQSA
ncbi:chromosome partitioning protein ParA [Vibrio sp. TRT 21S02]|uniref:chromosome partitioning protein ParA n=1 Tax=unclassified Vibrio TaxID=2614977 RepID=UPI00349F6A51